MSFFPRHSSVYNFIRIKKGPWNNHQNVMRNSQTNKSSDLSVKIKPQSYKQIIWDSRILLHFNNDTDNTKNNKRQKGINKWCQLYTVLPFSHFSMCSHQRCPFHRFGIVFPQQIKSISQTWPLCCHWVSLYLIKALKTESRLCTHLKQSSTTLPCNQWTIVKKSSQ